MVTVKDVHRIAYICAVISKLANQTSWKFAVLYNIESPLKIQHGATCLGQILVVSLIQMVQLQTMAYCERPQVQPFVLGIHNLGKLESRKLTYS